MSLHPVPELKIRHFEGPLDLLFHLIEKNDIDIYDIPIAEITDQYMVFLRDMATLDMEVASDFLVMAATLIHIKSRMLLPGKKILLESDEEDPREELVIRLLQYRRCKFLSMDLRERYQKYADCTMRLPSIPASLGFSVEHPPLEFEPDFFNQAIVAVCARNELRFSDLASKITHILKRDKISVRDKMKFIWSKLVAKGKVFFHELFPLEGTSKMDRIVGFLAVLELLRGNKIAADQDRPFDIIVLSEKEPSSDQDHATLAPVLGLEVPAKEKIDYD